MSRPNKKPITTPTSKVAEKPVTLPESTESLGFWQNSRLHAWLLFVICFLLYANTLSHDFCQDDSIVITDNMFTTKGVSGFGGILGNDTFYGFFKEEGKAALVAGGRYRPFTLLMFAFEYELFGKNPFVGHFINVLLFGAMCVLIYFLMLRLLTHYAVKNVGTTLIQNPKMVAFITALIFAAHPIHTEAVANIKGRDEIMTLLGSLSAVWFAIKFYEDRQLKNGILTFFCFFIGLMSKENAVTFVVLVPMIFYFFYHTNLMDSLTKAVPFVAATLVFLLLRGAVIGQQFGTEQAELMNNPFLKRVGNQYIPFELGEKFATILFTLGKYVQLLFVPFPLTHDYYPRHIDIMNFGNWQVLLSGVLYIGLGVLMLKNWAKRDLTSFGIAYFLITLSIVSNIIFPVGTNMAERFLFMPSLGFCLIAGVLFEKWGNILRGGAKVQIALVLVLVVFGYKTLDRNTAWKDNYTIFTTDVEVSKNSAKLQNSVGGETIEHFKSEGNVAIKNAKMTEAINHLLRATEIHPTYKNPYLLLGNAYFYLNDFDKSTQAYQQALKLDPNYKDALQNLQSVYRDGGRIIAQQQGNILKGIEFLQKAVEMNPKDAEMLSLLGTAYGMSQQPLKSIDVLERALSIRFDVNDARNLGVAYRQTNNIERAVEWESRKK
ncbi:MAG: tetratricopeptide repeat protein [Saprospiraceae bacterium]|nr:tetratricopeptide repeat protein [Saprospiraceae bacterium]